MRAIENTVMNIRKLQKKLNFLDFPSIDLS